jgi:hypothetical protein
MPGRGQGGEQAAGSEDEAPQTAVLAGALHAASVGARLRSGPFLASCLSPAASDRAASKHPDAAGLALANRLKKPKMRLAHKRLHRCGNAVCLPIASAI